jgi:type II secretory pathway component GspD/PulD (secretin)
MPSRTQPCALLPLVLGALAWLAPAVAQPAAGPSPAGPAEALPLGQQDVSEFVSLDFRDVPLSQVINALVYKQQVNILVPPDLTQRVTVKLDGVPWKSALETILANFGFGFEEIDGIIRIDVADRLNRTPITRDYEVRFLDGDAINRLLTGQLTRPENGRVIEQPGRAGTTLRRIYRVVEVPSVQKRIDDTLREFDRPRTEAARDVTGPGPDGLMSVNFEATPLVEAIGAVASRLRLSVALETSLSGTVDLSLRSVTFDRVMDQLTLTRGLAYDYDDKVLRIGLRTGFTPRRETRYYKLRYANVLDLRGAIRARLSKDAVFEPYTTTHGAQGPLGGSLGGAAGGGAAPGGGGTGGAGAGAANISREFFVMDTLAVLRDVEKIVTAADVVPRQVQIEVQILEISLNKRDQLGIRWNLEGVASGGGTATEFPFNKRTPIGNSAGGNNFTFGILSFQSFQLIVSALASQGRVRALSKPTITTFDRTLATILVGDRFPIFQQTTSAQTGLITRVFNRFEEIGIQLRVTPQILDPNQVVLNLAPNVSSRGTLINDVPIIQTRSVETQLMVAHGETAVIGGLMTDRRERGREGIPGLMDLKIIGHLFGRRTNTNDRAELLIFVTPRIVSYNPGPAPAPPFPIARSRG